MNKKIVAKLSGAGIYHADNPSVTLTAKTRNKEGHRVLENVDLEIHEGELVYLVGRVGSGKSSLLKTLYGELPLVEGEGDIVGFDLTELRQRDIPYLRRKLGMVFQETLFLSDRNVYDNLLCALRATGWSKRKEIDRRIDEVLNLVGLEGKESKMTFELSGGEQQRVIIARALLNSPDIILADEPTANLDPVTANDIAQIFQKVLASGTAIIMSTHNISLIEQYPARILHFAQNTICEVDIDAIIAPKSTI